MFKTQCKDDVVISDI